MDLLDYRAASKVMAERPAYYRLRWVRCTACGQKDKVQVSSRRGFRLRDRVSPCCQARMRPLAWRPTSGK